MEGPGRRLGPATWMDLDGRRVVVLLPVGSLEQHGPHLPLDTDTRIAVAVAEAAADRLEQARRSAAVVVAPALAFGASGEHAGFAGTLSIGVDALATVIVELARSAGPEVAALVVVNGHGGNAAALRRAGAQARGEGRPVHVWTPAPPAHPRADAHAGWVETSVLLHLAPELVRTDRAAPGNRTELSALLDELVRHGVRWASPNGVLGDPAGASAGAGRRILDGWAAALVELVSRLAGAQ